MTWHAQIIPFTDRADWLEKRKAGIGASDVAAIVGLSPWSSPYQVWAEKTQDYESEANSSMEWGLLLEDAIIQHWLRENDPLGVYNVGLVQHPKHPWAMATPDRIAVESPVDEDDLHYSLQLSATAVLEAKTDGSYAEWGEIPAHYECQAQWQMYVTGVEHATFAVLHGGRRFRTYELAQDQTAQQMLVDRVGAFHEKHIIGGEPPPVDDTKATARVLADLWAPEPEQVELGGEAVAALRQLVALKDQAKGLDDQIRHLENQVKEALSSNEIGLIGGVGAVSWKSSPRKGYYVEPTEVRTFRILKGAKS